MIGYLIYGIVVFIVMFAVSFPITLKIQTGKWWVR